MQGVFLEWLLSRGISRPSVPLAIKGDSGTGKTAIIEGWCAKHGLPCVKLNVSTMDETDAAGIVVRDGDYARTLSPQWYDKLRTGRGVLFLDEFNCARKEVADTFLTLICSRHLPNGDQLSDGILVVAAMNDAKVYDNYELSPAMRARFMWIRHTMSVSEWTAWFTATLFLAMPLRHSRVGGNLNKTHRAPPLATRAKWRTIPPIVCGGYF